MGEEPSSMFMLLPMLQRRAMGLHPQLVAGCLKISLQYALENRESPLPHRFHDFFVNLTLTHDLRDVK